MGMAASQARLLSLTARIHDVELQAQNIMAQKIALATQKDELYQEYCDALDATKIKVAFMNDAAKTEFKDANFSTLCNFDDHRIKQYALKDNMTGKLIVADNIKNAYDCYGNDKYAFAYAVMGFDLCFGWDTPEQGAEIGIGTAYDDYGFPSECGTGQSLYMTECEQIVYDLHSSGELLDQELVDKYNEILNATGDAEKKKALDSFREYLYTHKGEQGNYAEEIFEQMNYDKQESREYSEQQSDMEWATMSPEFNYYVNLWTAINEAGGCQAIDPECMTGEDGNNWFNNMVNAGLVSIMVWDEKGAQKEWSETSIATSTNNNYLQKMPDDKELKKAEAEYEHELDILKRKDTKFDTDLSKLETERTSITTEMESIKKVKDDNIDRTFGIFS